VAGLPMKQRLKNPRKIATLERLVGEKILTAWTRGGWAHGTAEVWTPTRRLFANYLTGDVDLDSARPLREYEPGKWSYVP
jgi:hypothetical protein